MSATPDTTPAPARSPLREHLPVLALLTLIGTETFLVSPLLPAIGRDLGVTAGEVGQSVTAYVLAYAILAPLLAPFGDRLPRRTSVVIGGGLFLLSNLAAAAAPSLVGLIAARVVGGVGAALAGPAIWAHLAESASDDQRGRIIGLGFAAFSLGQVIGVPLGGGIAQAADWRWPFAVLAVGTAAATLAAALRLPRATSASRVAERPGRRLAEATSAVWGSSVLVATLAVVLLVQAANLGAYAYLGTLLSEGFDLSTGAIGAVGALVGVASVVGARVGGRLVDAWTTRSRPWGALFGGLAVVLGIGVLIGTQGRPLVLALVGSAIWFLGSGALVTATQSALTTLVTTERATVVGWGNAAMHGGTAAGVALIAGLGASASAVTGVALGAIALGAVAALQLIRLEVRAAARASNRSAPRRNVAATPTSS